MYQWVRREEQYATLGANVVVELYSERHARQPTTRAWAIIGPADRNHRLAGQRASRPSAATPSVLTALADHSSPGAGDGGRCPLTFTCRRRH